MEITERKREFEGMDFDNHWQCWLVRRDGKKVTWEETNTSAGQRQVRMLAFYEALRRLAKLVPPLEEHFARTRAMFEEGKRSAENTKS